MRSIFILQMIKNAPAMLPVEDQDQEQEQFRRKVKSRCYGFNIESKIIFIGSCIDCYNYMINNSIKCDDARYSLTTYSKYKNKVVISSPCYPLDYLQIYMNYNPETKDQLNIPIYFTISETKITNFSTKILKKPGKPKGCCVFFKAPEELVYVTYDSGTRFKRAY